MTFGGCYIRSDSSIETMALKSVEIKGEQKELLNNFEITQIFIHSKPEGQEISYVFPNDMKICIYDLTFVVGSEIIKPTIKSKDNAKKIYEEAVEQGKTAIYGSNVRNGMSEFKLGNLPPETECKVIIKIALMSQVTTPDSFFIKFPLDIYTPSGSKRSLGVKASEFNFSLQCDSEIIENVTSNVQNYQYNNDTKLFTITNKIENQNNENSIIITFHTKERLQSSAFLDSKSHKDYQNYLLTLSPVISTTNISKNNEFVFLVDCSGSMSGRSIHKASECLEVFIRSLPLHSRFNIICFGSSYEKLFESSIEYNEQTMKKALNLISTLEANLGGTQIMEPLKDIFSEKRQFGQRQVFIITDGEVWDVESLLQLISDHSKENRCFTIGIGRGCDAGLVEGMARVSHGKSDFVQEGDSISEKVIPQLESSLLPSIESVEVHFEGQENESFQVSPFPIPPITIDSAACLFVRCKKNGNSSNEGILVTATLNDKPIEFTIDKIIELDDRQFGCSKAIFPLFVYNMIQNFEIKESLSDEEKAKIIDLSIASGVLCKYTGYVGIIEPTEEYQEEEEVEMAGGFDDLFDGGGFDCCCCSCSRSSVKVPKYVDVIGSDDDNVNYLKEEEEVEMAGGFDDLFDFGGGGGSYVPKIEKAEEKAENEHLCYSLMNMIKLQSFEGFWADLDRINGMLGVNVQKIDGLNVEDKDLEKKCISTILAIASFHVKSQNEKNTWSMIEHKAISWLKSNLPNVDIDKLIQQTEKSIKI